MSTFADQEHCEREIKQVSFSKDSFWWQDTRVSSYATVSCPQEYTGMEDVNNDIV